MPDADQSKKDYMKECGGKEAHVLDPCVNFKSEDVWVDVEQAVPMVHLALERMGHEIGPWLKNLKSA